MDTPRTSRREFCTQAISLVTVTSLLEGCGGGGGNPAGPGGGTNVPSLPTVNATTSGRTVTVSNVGASALSSVGSAALVQSAAGGVLVVRTAQDAFTALTAICTHEQCTITGFSASRFVCPCHGSQYSTSGAVQQGPATRALQTFTTQFTNDVLTITV